MDPSNSLPIDLRSLIREREGKRRCDLSPLLSNPGAFRQAVLSMCEPFRATRITKVAGLEGMGLGLAGAVAQEIRTGLVLFRKPGLLAWDTLSISFRDYTGTSKAFEIVYGTRFLGHNVELIHAAATA